jgi:hypothetical protein
VFVRYVLGTLSRLHPAYPGYDEAIDVPSAEWDNLIVLDGCRADAFERVVGTDRFDQYRSVVSAGSHSSEWTRRNFAGGEFGDIVYVSANPHTSKLAGSAFHDIVEMWKTSFDDDAGTVLPSEMSAAARTTADSYPDKRLIVHFMQPHGPFVGSDVPERQEDDRYWEAYDQNLAYVMDSVDELVADLSGQTVITADHGQIAPSPLRDAVGVSGHKPGLRHPGVVVVPWAVIDGDRRETVDGKTNNSTAEAVDDRLRDLGYKI